MSTHRAVAFVMKKEDIEVCVFGTGNDGAIHVCMSTRLPHRCFSYVIVMLLKVSSLLKHRITFNWRQPGDKHSQRLAASVHFHRSNLAPFRRGFPVPIFEKSIHMCRPY